MATSEPGTQSVPPDIINQLAAIGPATQQLRGLRPEAQRAAQASYEALLRPAEPGAVSQAERELIGLRVGLLNRAPAVVAEHRENLLLLAPELVAVAEQFPASPALPARTAQIIHFVDRLTSEPGAATRADIDRLRAAGLSAPEIVTIAQLIAYLSFQVRLTAGLRALQEENR